MNPHDNKDLSESTKYDAKIIPQNTREFGGSIKCEADTTSHNIREF
jgi:hypothetical protein